MTLTISEKQDLINAKNWNALVETDLLRDFRFNSTTFKQYTFERDFVMNFLFNETRFSAHSEYIRFSLLSQFYPGDVMKNVMSRIRDLNIQITTDDWKVIAKSVAALYASTNFDRTSCSYVLQITDKDANYLRALADDEIYKIISDSSLARYGVNNLNAEEFTKLSLEEQRKLVTRLHLGSTKGIVVVNGDERVFAPVAKTPGEIEKISRYLKIDVFKILADLNPDEYISMLLSMSDYNVPEYSLLPYFQNHKDFTLTNDQFKKLFDMYGPTIYQYIINNITMEQIEDKIMTIPIPDLIKRDDLTLNKITEARGTSNVNLCLHKFFTEEEIAANPHFFDPVYLNDRPCLYVTSDTFRLLNKAWNKRQRYSERLTDFTEIVHNMNTNSYTISNLRYLKSKTKASNEVVTNAILRKPIDEVLNSDNKKLGILKKFIAKFIQ